MTISAVVMQAARMKPLPASTPIAPVLQMLAAVLRPRTLRPSRMITPAPRKPMPLTTWAAIRVTLTSLSSNSGRIEKLAAPSATIAWVAMPEERCRHCRSRPTSAPRPRAVTRPMAISGVMLCSCEKPPILRRSVGPRRGRRPWADKPLAFTFTLT
ncbi:Uncharacterised protein [Acinetobacter baumannii]|nr:Uncharacterised protein [Acinetobacter baumannii]